MVSNVASGYDLDWVEDPPDDLKCLICLYVARDPQQHPGDATKQCGKVFCADCITEHRKISNKCPNCRQYVSVFQDSRSKTYKILAILICREPNFLNSKNVSFFQLRLFPIQRELMF